MFVVILIIIADTGIISTSPALAGVIIGGMIGFVASFVVSVSVPRLLSWYDSPVLEIQKEVVVRYVDLKRSDNQGNITGNTQRYFVNRIPIKNNGNSAARNCKAWLVRGNLQERISWLAQRVDRTEITLNAHDLEYVELCAIREDRARRIAPTEYGWGDSENDNRLLGQDTVECELLVTSSNVSNVKRKLRIVKEGTDDGTIVEFPNQKT